MWMDYTDYAGVIIVRTCARAVVFRANTNSH